MRQAACQWAKMFIPIIVAEAFLKTQGALPVNVKFLFEGQEEIGSPQLPAFLAEKKDLFACDLVLSSDGGQWDEDQPSMTLGTRGLAAVFVDVEGPDHDLHSGIYGGTIANPIHALVEILDSMHDKNGRITVDGFYNDVQSLTEEEQAQFSRVPYDEAEALLKTQMPDDVKSERASVVVKNTGSIEQMKKSVDFLYKNLSKIAEKRRKRLTVNPS